MMQNKNTLFYIGGSGLESDKKNSQSAHLYVAQIRMLFFSPLQGKTRYIHSDATIKS